jgi:hypothetical protein
MDVGFLEKENAKPKTQDRREIAATIGGGLW